MVFLSRTHLESVLLISFTIAAILLALPREHKEGEYGGGGTKTTTPIPTVIFNTLPPPTFHVFVLSVIFAFTFSLSAILMLDTDNNGTRNNCNYSQLHIVLVGFFEGASLASIASALAILCQALFLTATSSACWPPNTASSLLLYPQG
ncbi:hypothetical protein RHGRI_018250 [Rhododendron griersonianum]|uniref:Uncharacterized protein n=1 Tax=Rhododendron griersonianum TaxID=479676 RepID=A0AAV6K0V4_9ERIC|nr:hypothetical protein RHGRI_018250 [Rhododendron griersonianum]